jgi:hypothetical protein
VFAKINILSPELPGTTADIKNGCFRRQTHDERFQKGCRVDAYRRVEVLLVILFVEK